jgi:hypothetical protein
MIRAFAVIGIFLVGFPIVTRAATLYFDPPQAELSQGDTTVLSLRLDVDEAGNECVNAVDAVVHYPSSIKAVDTSLGQSIMPLWVESPKINANSRTITMAGGIPNGYCGRVPGDPRLTNVVADLVFRYVGDTVSTSSNQVANITFGSETAVYPNDGSGEAYRPTTYASEIRLRSQIATTVRDPWADTVSNDVTSPEPFSIQLEKSQIFDGKYYISFNTTDKQSGIAAYEVMEEPLAKQSLFRFGAVDAPWRAATSPYELTDQTLNSTIRVRATDKAGNEYTATLVPDPSLRTTVWTWQYWVVGVALAFLFVTLVVVFALRMRAYRRRKTSDHLPGYHADYDKTSDTYDL